MKSATRRGLYFTLTTLALFSVTACIGCVFLFFFPHLLPFAVPAILALKTKMAIGITSVFGLLSFSSFSGIPLTKVIGGRKQPKKLAGSTTMLNEALISKNSDGEEIYDEFGLSTQPEDLGIRS